jgi:hypothetical protein
MARGRLVVVLAGEQTTGRRGGAFVFRRDSRVYAHPSGRRESSRLVGGAGIYAELSRGGPVFVGLAIGMRKMSRTHLPTTFPAGKTPLSRRAKTLEDFAAALWNSNVVLFHLSRFSRRISLSSNVRGS